MSKNKKQKKNIAFKREETIEPPTYTEGYWEDFILENDNFYDVDINTIYNHNKPILEKIELWEKKYTEASSWLGKWYCQIQIDNARAKLKHYK